MELNIIHLYPDSMNLYGEYANIALLRRHLEAAGVTVAVRAITCEDIPDFSEADLIYMGAGTERSVMAAMLALVHHREKLMAAVDAGALLLFTGNAMTALGASVTDAAGTVWPGLALAEFTTVETDRRRGVDVVAESSLLPSPAVGFMNKCSTTAGVTTPLFDRLPLGFGNEAEGGSEGFSAGNVLATHLSGPVLVKNPALLELVIRRLFAAKGWACPAELPTFPHEAEAYAVTLRELQGRIK